MRFCAFIFLLCYSHLVLALGFSDIELKSYLGENLNAQIDINDADSALDVSCFVAKDFSEDGANRRFNLVLRESNGSYQLLITTRNAIIEPIIDLRVSYACDPNINREYVLLIDPPSSINNLSNISKPVVIEPNNTKNAGASSNNKKNDIKSAGNIADNSDNDVINSGANNTASSKQVTSTAKPGDVVVEAVKKKRAKKKLVRNKSSSVDDRLNEAYTGKTPLALLSNSSDNAKSSMDKTSASKNSDKPYLVISGGNADGNSASIDNTQIGLALRLETQIDFSRAVTETPMTAADAMDEVTVMANRLTHLEQQILSLQSKNTQLKAEAEKAKNQGFTLSESHYGWLYYIGVVLSIIALLALAEGLRRKILRHRLKRDESIWFVNHNDQDETGSATNDKLSADAKSRVNASNIEAMIFNEPSYGDEDPNGTDASANSVGQNAENDSESVLDHAEVFIAHGRPTLAIQLLQNHLEELPTESPAIWLKLLSLLSTESTESEYDAAVSECNQFFNIKLPKFGEAAEPDESSIEDYPHIVVRLEGVWGSQYATGFLNDLIYNQQSQPREGFARNTFEELFFLKQIAEKLQPVRFAKEAANAYKPDMSQPIVEKLATNGAMFAAATLASIDEKDETHPDNFTTQIDSEPIDLVNQPASESLELAADNQDVVVEFTESEASLETALGQANEFSNAVFLNIDDETLLDKGLPNTHVDMLIDIEADTKPTKKSKSLAIEALPIIETEFVDDSFDNAKHLVEEIDFSVTEEAPENNVSFEDAEFTETELEKALNKNSVEGKQKKKEIDDNSIDFDWDLPENTKPKS